MFGEEGARTVGGGGRGEGAGSEMNHLVDVRGTSPRSWNSTPLLPRCGALVDVEPHENPSKHFWICNCCP